MTAEAKALAVKAQAPLEDMPEALTPMLMLDRAVASGAPVEVVEKLMGLHERWEANQARKAFDAALARAKANMPVIVKEQETTGAGGSYKYEDLAAIARAIDPILAAQGLSYRFRTESNGSVKVTCIVSHGDGHSEENALSSEPDATGSKNSIQAIGSAVTYLQRYTLKAALGLAVVRDDDGAKWSLGAASEPISAAQEARIRDLIGEVGADSEKLCRYFKVESIPALPASKFHDVIAALETKRNKA